MNTSMRPKRKTPSVTELIRVGKVLESDPGVRPYLDEKTLRFSKRTGEVVYFSSGVVRVAGALMAKGLNPERAHVGIILRTAVEVFAIRRGRDPR